MLSFLKEDFDYKEVYLIYSRLLKRIEEKGLISYNLFFSVDTPVSKEYVIDSIEKILENKNSIYSIIGEDLNIEVFENLGKIDYKKCLIFSEGIVYNNTLYITNPYSSKLNKIKNELKENNLLFNKIGFITKNNLKNLELKMKEKNIIKINSLYLDQKIQEIFSLAINSNSKKIKINPLKNKIQISILKDDYIDVNIEIGSIQNYENIIKYLDYKFQKIDNWKLNNKNYKFIYQKENYSINNKEMPIIYFNFYYDNNIISLEDINIPFKEKEIFNRSLLSPSGIILISGIMESGKQERIYSIINHLKETNKSITSIEDIIKKEVNYISQYEIGIDKEFDYKSFNSKIIAFHEVKNKKDLEYIISESSKGKLIIAGINAVNSINAISKILSFDINKKLFSELLLCVIHSNLIKKVCPYCSEEYKFISDKNYNHFIDLDNSPLPYNLIKKENENGCYHCVSGYNGKILVTELLENDKMLSNEIINNFDIEKIKIEKRSSSWKNCFEVGIENVKNSKTTINALIHSLGFYKK